MPYPEKIVEALSAQYSLSPLLRSKLEAALTMEGIQAAIKCGDLRVDDLLQKDVYTGTLTVCAPLAKKKLDRATEQPEEAGEVMTPPPARVTRGTCVTSTGLVLRTYVPIQASRPFFDAICTQLSKRDSTSKFRHIRVNEAPITLAQVIDISKQIKREVAILYDIEGKPQKGTVRYTRICLYSSNAQLTLSGAQKNKTGAASHITLPVGMKSRYRYVVHVHPTYSRFSKQLAADIQHASEHVEVVVTHGGAMFYYNNSGCLNQYDSTGSIVDDLKAGCDAAHVLTLETPITEAVVGDLDRVLPKRSVRVCAADDEEWMLFAGDAADLSHRPENP